MVADERAHPLDREVITCVSGSPPSRELFVALAGLGITPVHVYGATELYGPDMVCERQEAWRDLPLDQQAGLLGRQGVNYVTASPVRVVDEHDREVPADGTALGEIVMRGNNVMAGYHDDPAQTEATLANGWYRSGDLGVRHPDGYVEIRDRKKDIIISGGENISTIEVEHAIGAHPAVAAVAVVSTPHERWGERPKAFVELKAGMLVSTDEIAAFVRERLPGYMCPDRYEFTQLERTSTGKVPKRALRDREWAGYERRVG